MSECESMNELSEIELKVLKYHKLMGADYSKLISHRFGIKLCEATEIHKKLFDLSLLEKVSGSIIDYHTNIKRLKTIKHRNHTYYVLSRKGELCLREYEREFGEIQLNLKYPYKR
jgi:predicted transcriptional regulator